MSERIAGHDWASTPLGPVDGLAAEPATAVRIVLGSRFAMWMAWGPELTFFYNDAYARDTLASKHPWALGQRADAVWAEIWDDIGPRIDQVLATGDRDLGRGPAAVPRAQRLPRGDLPHVLLQPAARRRRRDGRDAVRGRRGDRARDRRAAPARRCASSPRTPAAATDERELFAARRPQPRRATARDLPFAFAYTARRRRRARARHRRARRRWPDGRAARRRAAP